MNFVKKCISIFCLLTILTILVYQIFQNMDADVSTSLASLVSLKTPTSSPPTDLRSVKVAPEGCIPNASVLRSANEVCNNGVQASEACRGLMTSASGSTMKESNEPPESFYQGVSHNPFMLPPRKTNMDYIPVQENVGMLREKEDVCSYEPNHPQCSTKWNMFRENVVEGMDDGGGFGGADFGKFIEVFFEMIGFIIYILVTLPDHIIAFVEGFVWLILAGVDLFIAGFELFALQLQDMGILIADLFTCGMTMQENLPMCTIFWFLDFAIFVIVLLFAWVPITLVRLLTLHKLNLNPMYLTFFGVKGYRDIDGGRVQKDGFLAKLSHWFYKSFGFEFMHFPDYILKKCYTCDIVGDFMNIAYDFTVGFIRIFEYPIQDLAKSMPYFWHGTYLDMMMGQNKLPPMDGGFGSYMVPMPDPRLGQPYMNRQGGYID